MPDQPKRSSRRRLFKAAVLGGGVAAAAATGIGIAGAQSADEVTAQAFAHPGLLHDQADFDRMKSLIASGDSLATQTWQLVQGSPLASLDHTPRPIATVIRGGTGQNYGQFMPDVHAMYQNALIWRINGDTAHGDKARDIANVWSQTLEALSGNADRWLMAGTQGWQLANVGELLRGYPGFDLASFQSMLRDVFYPMNSDFLVRHNGACDTNYRANWDTCNMASIFGIGSFLDDQAMMDEAVDYFHSGVGNGCIYRAANFMHESNRYYQWEESGRDQGHTMGGLGWMTVLCEMAWKRGIDLYVTDGNRYAKAAHYVARYNGGTDVPYTSYSWQQGTTCAWKTEAVIGSGSRGDTSPIWAMIRRHLVGRRGLDVPYVVSYADGLGVENGGGYRGTTSGGFDHLGFGTLTFR